jgi:hypothetical protein
MKKKTEEATIKESVQDIQYKSLELSEIKTEIFVLFDLSGDPREKAQYKYVHCSQKNRGWR